MAKDQDMAQDIMDEAKRGDGVEDIVKRAKMRPKKKLSIELSSNVAEKLQKISASSGDTETARAAQYVRKGADRDYAQMCDELGKGN